MNSAEIKKIAGHALSAIDSVLNRYLPGGKREGHEYLPLNPKRADSSRGSFSINTDNGKWADFADDAKGNDLVSLAAYLNDCSQSQAAEQLAEFLNIPLEKDLRERATRPQNGKGNAKVSSNTKKQQDGDNDWQCVMPIPDNAPKPPECHPRHGTPSIRYPYLNIDGRLNYYHDRYDKPEGEKKQFSPLTLWQKGKAFKWQFKAPPEPRPLYGLPGLVAYPDVDCWIVEGEKAVMALEKLLPNHHVSTWQGGSNAVTKADFKLFAKRDCIIFRDNDQAGMKACMTLIEQLQTVKAASIRILDITKLERASGQPLQPGDDAADLLAAGWAAEQFAEFLQRDGVLVDAVEFAKEAIKDSTVSTVPSKPESETPQRGFEVFESGVYFIEPTKDGKLRRRWICGKLEVLALARTPDNREWGKLVTFQDYDHKVKRLVVPMRHFNGEGLSVTSELLAEGLNIAPKARQLVLEFLQTSEVDNRARLTDRIGWHDNNKIFVMPQISVGESSEEWLYIRAEDDPFKQRGTLEEWQENISRLCAGNSRLVLGVSAVFAAPLLRLVNAEGGGIHYRGDSSSGKSTILRIATSVIGSPDYFLNWRSTDTSIENLAQDRNDSALILDDLAQVNAALVNDVCLMLGNGLGKNRGKAEGGNRKTARWKTMLLSTGEVSLSQHAASVGRQIHAGSEVRINDVPVDCGVGMKGFECIHDYESSAKFSKALSERVNQYYGTAFPAFLNHVLNNQQEIPKVIRDCDRAFVQAVLTDKSSSQALRVASRFSIIIAAGELATSWGITGWHSGESMKAGIACYKAWLDSFGGNGNREERNIVSTIRHFLELHGDGRFVLLERADDTHAPKTLQRCGYRKTAKDGAIEYYVFSESFKREMCGGLDYRTVARLLIDKGYMRPGDGKNLCPKVDLPHEGRIRIFHILPSIWNDDDDDG